MLWVSHKWLFNHWLSVLTYNIGCINFINWATVKHIIDDHSSFVICFCSVLFVEFKSGPSSVFYRKRFFTKAFLFYESVFEKRFWNFSKAFLLRKKRNWKFSKAFLFQIKRNWKLSKAFLIQTKRNWKFSKAFFT